MDIIVMICFTVKGFIIGMLMNIFWEYSRQAARRKVLGGEKISILAKSKITCATESALTFTPMARFMKESGLWARDMAVVLSLNLRVRNSSAHSRRAINGDRVHTCLKDVELSVFGMAKM